MTNQEKLEAVKAKIVETSDRFKRYCNCNDRLCEMCVKNQYSIDENLSITLEDFLITFFKNNIPFSVSVLGSDWIDIAVDYRETTWLLGKPLYEQSEDTINLLYENLC